MVIFRWKRKPADPAALQDQGWRPLHYMFCKVMETPATGQNLICSSEPEGKASGEYTNLWYYWNLYIADTPSPQDNSSQLIDQGCTNPVLEVRSVCWFLFHPIALILVFWELYR